MCIRDRDWIVLSYEVGEYLILYKIPVGNNLKDSSIWGADVYWEDDTQIGRAHV